MIRIGEELTENKIPLEDALNKFVVHDRTGNLLTTKDFSYNLLPKFLKLQNVISQNMSEVLLQKYVKSKYEQEFEVEKFTMDLDKVQASEKHIRFFKTKEEYETIMLTA